MNPPPAASSIDFRAPLICLALAVAVFGIYLPVRNFDFINYDDPSYFSANPHVLGGLTWPNIKWAFTTGDQANWHPLTWVSLMLDAQIFGRGPAAPHLMNVLFHCINSILVFFLLRQLTATFWRSAAVAMLFAIHPLHVESVAWIAERKDVLSGFFGLLTLLCYAQYAINIKSQALWSGRARLYLLSLFFFICGLMSKPMLVTLPFVMLLLDYWPLQRFNSSLLNQLNHSASQAINRKVSLSRRERAGVRESRSGESSGPVQFEKESITPSNNSAAPQLLIAKLPFFLLSAIASVLTFIVQKKGGAVSALTVIPMTVRIENTFVSYARYLMKTVCPINLANPYPPPHSWPILIVVLSITLFAGLCAAAIAARNKYPFLLTGWFWFAGMLVPVIGLVQVGAQAMADRYMYLPVIGILIVIIWLAAEICLQSRAPRPLILVSTAILFLVCAVRARNQVSLWKNDETLFEHALAVTKNNYVASIDLGYWYAQHGLPQALNCYHNALQMAPNDPTALYDVGNAVARFGRWNEAIADYSRAAQITPDQPDILNNLGFALAQDHQLDRAAECFQKVLKLKPASLEARINLATMDYALGRYADAAQQYQAVLLQEPNNLSLLMNLGDSQVRMGQTAAAAEYYRRALELDPNNPAIRARLKLYNQNAD